MSCTSCSRTVERHLDTLEGLIRKEVNHASNSGKFTIDENQLTQAQLIDVINQCHYKVPICDSLEKVTKTKVIPPCPQCKVAGLEVPNTVLRSNLKPVIYKQINLEDEFIICLNPTCSTAYYTAIHYQVVDKNELKRALYFKNDSERKIICYCNNIDLKQIEAAVKVNQLTNWEHVMTHYRTKVIEKCETLNPTGLCCRDLFEEVVKKM